MKPFLLFLSLACCLIPKAQPVGAGRWDIHLPYNRGNSVCDGGDRVFVGTTTGVYALDKSSKRITRYSTVNGLSDAGVNAVGYSPEARCLLVGYANGNIDLIKDDRTVNIRDLLNSPAVNEKTINNVSILGTRAYLSCNFGIAVVDLVAEELPQYVIFTDNQGLELAVNDLEFADDGTLLAATAGGLFYYTGNGAFQDFGAWVRYSGIFVGTYNAVVNHGGTLYASYSRKLSNGIDNQDTIYRYDGSTWKAWDSLQGRTVRSLNVENGRMVVVLGPQSGFAATVIVKNTDGSDHVRLSDELLFRSLGGFTDANGETWLSDGQFGVMRVFNFDKRDFFFPKGPFSPFAFRLMHDGQRLWVASGGTTPGFSPLFRVDGVFSMDDEGNWNHFNTENQPLMNVAPDFLQVVSLTSSEPVTFAASLGAGLFEISGETVTARYDSSTTGGAISRSSGGTYSVSSVSVDDNGAVWVAMSNTSRPLAVRRPDGTWKSFFIPGVGAGQVNYVKALSNGHVWISVRGSGIYAVRHDNYLSISQVRNINTNIGTGSLPTPFVTCITEEKDGEVWVGTENGFIIFYNPGSVFSNTAFNGIQPVVKAADGNNEKLLDGVFIRDITVDGGNRKWMATFGAGAYLISEDGYTIQQHFLQSNTPLISDNLLSIAVHPSAGTVFFATESGIISYRGDATEAGLAFSDQVYAFPNPVRESFTGPITIAGLAMDSELKITDISGQVIYQTRSNGGTAIWLGTGFNGRRAQTGVYLVFAANADGSEREVTRILIIN